MHTNSGSATYHPMNPAQNSPLVDRVTRKLENAICYALGGNALSREDDYRKVIDTAPYLAQTAIAACHAEEMWAFIREIANDDLDRVSPGLISRAAVLLAKLDSKP